MIWSWDSLRTAMLSMTVSLWHLTYGLTTDNAGGIAEMAELSSETQY